MREKISIEDIDKLSSLSKLEFTDEEKMVLVEEVDGIIDLLNQCADVEIGEEFKARVQNLRELRNDEVIQGMDSKDVFSSTDRCHDGYFSVPKVVD